MTSTSGNNPDQGSTTSYHVSIIDSKKNPGAYKKATDPSHKKDALPVVVPGTNGQATNFMSLSSFEKQRKSVAVYVNTPVSITVKDSTGATKTVNYPGYFKSPTPTPAGSKPRTLTTESTVPTQNPTDYQWNLPPHKWSLPVLSGSAWDKESLLNSDPKTKSNPYDPEFHIPKRYYDAKYSVATVPEDVYRRGRIWYKAGDPNVTIFNGSNGTGKVDYNPKDRLYGFQFMWNPESFSTTVAVQMDATPNTNDRFLAVAGAFPATETISFTVYLDRTNDFADLYKRVANGALETSSIKSWDSVAVNLLDEDIKKYSGFGNDSATRKTQIVDMLRRGTLADLEYLYRAINGKGVGKAPWTNGRGIETADIGYLMPTLLNIDVGPLSYQGYVTNLNVQHTAFTPNMVPIRTTLSISLNLLATSGLSSATAENNKNQSGGN